MRANSRNILASILLSTLLSIPLFAQISTTEKHPIFLSASPFHSLSGQVFKANFTTDSVVVYLYREQVQGIVELVDSVRSFNQRGAYRFDNMVSGTYYLRARLMETGTEFLDTYYGDSPAWINSKAIILRNNMTRRDINLGLEGNARGSARITGSVKHGLTSTGYYLDDPAVGLPVLLMSDNSVMRRTYTDVNGDYEFNGFPVATYEVVIDYPGKSMSAYTVKMNSAEEEINDVNFMVEKSTIEPPTSTVGIEVNKSKEFSVYPNPFESELMVTSPFDRSTVTVIDNTGKERLKIVIEGESSIDLSHLEQGMYYLIEETEADSNAVKIVKYN